MTSQSHEEKKPAVTNKRVYIKNPDNGGGEDTVSDQHNPAVILHINFMMLSMMMIQMKMTDNDDVNDDVDIVIDDDYYDLGDNRNRAVILYN